MKKISLISLIFCSLQALTHTVEKGDTLYQIAKKYGLSVQQIKTQNKLSTNSIDIGQEIMISEESASSQQPSSSGTSATYTIQAGDSLYQISKRHGVSIGDLIRWNEITDVKDIKIGSVLKVSEGSQLETPVVTKQQVVEPVETKVSQSSSSAETYVMQKGDTLYAVARKHGVNFRDLIAWNHIANPSSIAIGQRIRLTPNDSYTQSKPPLYPQSVDDELVPRGEIYGEHPYQEISSQDEDKELSLIHI